MCETCVLNSDCSFNEKNILNGFNCPGLSGDDYYDELSDFDNEDDTDLNSL